MLDLRAGSGQDGDLLVLRGDRRRRLLDLVARAGDPAPHPEVDEDLRGGLVQRDDLLRRGLVSDVGTAVLESERVGRRARRRRRALGLRVGLGGRVRSASGGREGRQSRDNYDNRFRSHHEEATSP